MSHLGVAIQGEYQDLYHFELVAKILADELAQIKLAAEPLDVAETIETLTEEMENMPEVICDCREAAETFGELDQTLDRMYSLADRAVEAGAREPGLLTVLDGEFSGHAQIVARLADSVDFEGPSLSLRTVTQAKVARQVLGYLAAARRKFSKRLEEQRHRISSAMEEAMSLLDYILTEVEEISYETKMGLGELLERVTELGASFGTREKRAPLWLN
ncbi:MAG: hypothetical protein LBT38_01445 [Deltaproteobacteria bacterium]|jgi:septation ring formation regulator EzrA|nr:hypothetical protein [Deltaproteobacteria bacterium]